jgi:arylsulfatase A-like enzyme
MDSPKRHVATLLCEVGYDTVLAGFQHEHGGEDSAREIGYQTFPSTEAYDDHETARAARKYLQEADAPFFMSAAFFNTHKPFPDSEKHDIDPDGVAPFGPLPDVPAIREAVAGYHASARTLDECVGIVLDALAETGRLEETLVVYTTDHGPAFPGMKCTLTDWGTRVAMLARFPDAEGPRGETTEGLVSHTDFVPTLCDYLGLETPDYVQGTSWLSARDDPAGFEGHDAVFGEMTYHAAYEPKRSVRTDRYRYIRRYGDYEQVVLPNIDDGPAKRFLFEHGLGERTLPREALYDTYHDPGEQENRLDDPVYADVLEDLRARLDDWMARTDDPLLDGPVRKPPGGEVSPQDGRDPGTARKPDDAR